MRSNLERAVDAAEFSCRPLAPVRPVPGLREDLLQGFARRPRSLPPKYFYDARGSQLFERICATPEYYPCRSEAALLAAHAAELVDLAQPRIVVELGSGNSRKTCHILSAAERLGGLREYWPLDVCREALEQAGQRLTRRYPWLRIRALVGDYLAGLGHLPATGERRLFLFLGGTIGNFSPQEARAFLTDLRACMGPEDFLLLGADRVKSAVVLEAAYNDAAGVTAAFNLNLLQVINRELQADFDPAGFCHRALYNRRRMQIEMLLVARRRQRVHVGALERAFEFARGEAILTEISRKFTRRTLTAMLEQAGFTVVRHIEGGEHLFSLVLAQLS